MIRMFNISVVITTTLSDCHNNNLQAGSLKQKKHVRNTDTAV